MSGLYYCNTAGDTATTVDCVYSKFTEDSVSHMDGASTDKKVVNAWATVTTIRRVRAKTVAQGRRDALHTSVGIPVIPEESLFKPILDPLAEQPLYLGSHVVPPSQQSMGAGDNMVTLSLDRGRRVNCPTNTAEHTEDQADEEGSQDMEFDHDATPAEQPPRRPQSAIY